MTRVTACIQPCIISHIMTCIMARIMACIMACIMARVLTRIIAVVFQCVITRNTAHFCACVLSRIIAHFCARVLSCIIGRIIIACVMTCVCARVSMLTLHILFRLFCNLVCKKYHICSNKCLHEASRLFFCLGLKNKKPHQVWSLCMSLIFKD